MDVALVTFETREAELSDTVELGNLSDMWWMWRMRQLWEL